MRDKITIYEKIYFSYLENFTTIDIYQIFIKIYIFLFSNEIDSHTVLMKIGLAKKKN